LVLKSKHHEPSSRSYKTDLLIVAYGLGCGGTEKVVAYLSDYFCQKGRSVTLVTIDHEDNDFFNLNPRVVRISLSVDSLTEKTTNHSFGSQLYRLLKLRRIIRNYRPKTIISFNPSVNILMLVSSVGINTKRIICERNNPYLQRVSRKLQITRKVIYKMADLITVNSDAALKYFSDLNFGHKTSFVSNPIMVTSATFHEQSRQKTILFVGRLTHQKGLDILLTAFSLSDLKSKGWQLIVVGEGADKQHYQKLAEKLSIHAFVSWVGLVSDLRAWYTETGLYVLPSRYEGTPNSLYEALSYGAPAICSESLVKVHPIIDIVKPWVTFENESVQDLCEKLRHLCLDEDFRRSLAMDGHRYVGALGSISGESEWEELLN